MTSFGDAFRLIFSGDTTLWEIVATTLRMSLTSSVLALLIGAPIGVVIAINDFRGKKTIERLLKTFMGLPPVVVGIIVYMLFSGVGIFGGLRLMYTVEVMIIAQVLLITPIVAGLTESYVSSIAPSVTETATGIGLKKGKIALIALNESKYQLISVYLMGFSRAIAEVGAVQIVGGNILHKTRVMTTAIALNYNTGEFYYALALGILLLLISFTVNWLAGILQDKLK